MRIKKYSDKTVKEKIHILSEYKYSSFAGYINLKARVDFINYAKVLGNFDGDTIEGRRKYRQFVYKGLEKDAENPLEMGENSGIVGLSGFKAYLREKYLDGATRESQREQPRLKAVKEIYTPKVLIKHFCKIIDVDEKEVCRRSNNSTDRAILMELLYRFCKITQAEIGQMVGKIDYSSVSVARKRLRIKGVVTPLTYPVQKRTKVAGKGGDRHYEENKVGASPDAHSCLGSGRCSKHRARPRTLSLVDSGGSGYCVVVPDGGGRFRLRATRCAPRKERREIQLIKGE